MEGGRGLRDTGVPSRRLVAWQQRQRKRGGGKRLQSEEDRKGRLVRRAEGSQWGAESQAPAPGPVPHPWQGSKWENTQLL